MDALHIAFAENSEIDYFVTTDRILSNTAARIKLKTKVLNPIEFLEVLENEWGRKISPN